MNNRSTIDIVVLVWAMTIAIQLLVATAGVIIGKIMRPTMDVTNAAEVIANAMMAITGAVIGFIGGRAQGRLEANGNAR
jgi:hypothetical protein